MASTTAEPPVRYAGVERPEQPQAATPTPAPSDDVARGVSAGQWLETGLRLAGRGLSREAADHFRVAASLDPALPQARLNRGVALAQAGDSSAALLEFDVAVRQWPRYAEAHLNQGKSLSELKRYREAIAAFRRTVAIDPASIDALNGWGLALTHLGRAGEAVVVLRQAVRLNTLYAGAWSNLGFAYAVAGLYDDADSAFRRALSIDPALPEAHVNRGNAFKEQGRLTEAIACYDLAMLSCPRPGSARWNRSLALLQQGDFARGWIEYESRWDRGETTHRRSYEAPRWSGEPLAGRTVLVHSEQGLGDTVMFARYAASLNRMGARVVFEAPAPLVSVLQSCPDIDLVVAEGQTLPQVDWVIAAMSLPRAFGTTLASIPCPTPYLRPHPIRREQFRRRFAKPGTLTVGLVWQGNPSHQWDRHRSLPLRLLKPLADVPGVRMIALQRGPGREQLHDCPFPIQDVIGRHEGEADAVEDLAACISAVDLLITVDTMPAHLAGALGVPAWVLLSTMVDWRWMNDRADSPWYPTLRLFRQSIRDDWPPVIDRVADALRLLAARTDHQSTTVRQTGMEHQSGGMP